MQKCVPRSSLETIICSEAEQSSQDAESTDIPVLSALSSLSADLMVVTDSDTCDHGPGIDEVSRIVSVTAWDSARESILKTAIEINAMPFNQLCIPIAMSFWPCLDAYCVVHVPIIVLHVYKSSTHKQISFTCLKSGRFVTECSHLYSI